MNYIIQQNSGQFKPYQIGGKLRESRSLLEGKRTTIQQHPHHDSFDSFSLHSNKKLTNEKLHFMINQKNTFDVYNQLNTIGNKSRSPRGGSKEAMNNSLGRNSGKDLMLA